MKRSDLVVVVFVSMCVYRVRLKKLTLLLISQHLPKIGEFILCELLLQCLQKCVTPLLITFQYQYKLPSLELS